jgi:hypothetical protein
MNKHPMRVRKWKLKAKEILSGENNSSKKIPKFLAITKNSIIYRNYLNGLIKK